MEKKTTEKPSGLIVLLALALTIAGLIGAFLFEPRTFNQALVISISNIGYIMLAIFWSHLDDIKVKIACFILATLSMFSIPSNFILLEPNSPKENVALGIIFATQYSFIPFIIAILTALKKQKNEKRN